MFKIKVNRNIISVQETEPVTSGSVSVYHCQFSFDPSWEGFFRSAVFRAGAVVRTIPLDGTDSCDIPWELLVKENIGLPVEVSVYGTKDETEILPTIWDKLGRIRGGSEPGDDVQKFSPSVYDRIVSLVKVYSDKTKGDKGDKGDPGEGDMVATVYDPDGAVASEGGISSYVDGKISAIPAPDVSGQISAHNTDTAAHADIRAELATKTNPNLLDNWYFANPVNQRGGYITCPGQVYNSTPNNDTVVGNLPDGAYYKATQYDQWWHSFEMDGVTYYQHSIYVLPGYVGAGYTIDRWLGITASVTVQNSVKVVPTVYNNNFTQRISGEVWNSLVGRTVTLSFLVTDIEGEIVISTYNTVAGKITETGLVSVTVDIPEGVLDQNKFFGIGGASGTSITILAAKLELGSTQTLAHQDADGNWVLNEIPDYGEELRKCQRYYYTVKAGASYATYAIGFATSATEAGFMIQYPVEMRVTPAFSYGGKFAVNSAAFGGVSIGAVEQSRQRTVIRAIGSGYTRGYAACLQDNGDGESYLAFDAEL